MTGEAKQAKVFVERKITRMAEGPNEAAARATLAKLRRGVGKAPGGMPELWGITLDGLPEALSGKTDAPSRGEWAVHTALTLFALHQQGKDLKKQCMSKDGEPFGAAVRRLITNDDDEKRVKRRFDAAATSGSLEEFSHHLRGLVQLLKAQDLPMDYPALAEDLCWFQIPDARDSVRLRWGRDFYGARKKEENENQIEQ